jgi:hypothetical protein
VERFDKVIVGAKVQARDSLVGPAAGRQHENKKRRTFSTHAVAYLESIHPWQVEVEYQ